MKGSASLPLLKGPVSLKLALIAALILLVAFPSASWAQRSAAAINGTVRDTTGAVIPDATIVLTNTETNVAQTALTNATGEYVVLNILPGTYVMKASKEGFQTINQPAFTLQVNQTTTFDFTLQVGSTTQTVTVEAAAAGIETSTAELGSVVTQRMVDDIPLNGRNFSELLELTPGVSPISTAQNSGGWGGAPLGSYTFPSVNGQTNRSNLWLMDGINNQGEFESTYNIAPQIDDIEEFKVQSHNDEAQFGGALGGIINVVTKGGTNSLHGDAFEFHRDRALDGRGFFLAPTEPKQAFTQNQFGLTLGGPIYIPHLYNGKNRTFFYTSYEGFRDHAASASLSRVPTPAELSGDLSDQVDSSGKLIQIYNPYSTVPDPNHSGYSLLTPFPGNIIPAGPTTLCSPNPTCISPAALAYATAWPAPINTGIPSANALDTSPYILRQDEGSVRFDEQLNSRNALFIRYTALNQPLSESGGFVGYRTGIFFHADNMAAMYTHTFSGSAVLSVSFGRNNAQYNNPSYYTNLPANFLENVGFTSDFAIGTFIGGASGVPGFSIPNFAGGGTNVSDTHMSDIYEYKADLSKLHGRHTLKMGVDIASNNASALYENVSVTFTSGATSCSFCYAPLSGAGISPGVGGVGVASFLLDAPYSSDRRNVHETEHGGWIDGFYIQDQWKPTDKLSVNLGLRYDTTIMPVYGNEQENTDTTGDVDFNNGTYVLQKMVPPCNPPSVVAPCIPVSSYAAAGSLPAHVVIDPNSNHKTFANFTDNWQPRVGIAYRLKPALVLHASYGRFFENWAAVTQTAQNTEGSWPQIGEFLVNNLNHNSVPTVSMKDPFAGASTAGIPADTPFISSGFVEWYMNPLQKNPYSDQWTVGIEQQLGANTTLSANYVGARNERLDVGGNYNVATTPGPGPVDTHQANGAAWTPDPRQPYPYIPPTFYDRSNGWGNYNSFQFSLNHRTSKGLSYLISYTWSKNMSSGTDGWYGADGTSVQQPYNIRGDYSVTGFDLTHILSTSWVYQFPFGKGQRFSTGNRGLDYIVGNWRFNGIFFVSSGQPFNNGVSTDIANTGNITERAERVTGVTPFLNKGAPSKYGMYWENPAAFTTPAAYTYGSEGRNDMRMDWPRNFDLSLFRTFPLYGETKRLEFRCELFNAFNTPRFGGPDSTVSDQYFGQVNSTANSPRIIQLALKLYF
jgi:outer membrane receptor protein involved in Fe transport